MSRRWAKQAFQAMGGMAAVRFWRRNGLTILFYHKFQADDVAGLTRQCEYLGRHYRVLPMSEAAARIRDGAPVPQRSVVITIDDGHRGFFDYAAPVFRRFGFTPIVYLTTGFVDTGGWLWFDRLEYAFHRTARASVSLDLPARAQNGKRSLALKTATHEDRIAAANEAIETAKRMSTVDCAAWTEGAVQALGAEPLPRPPAEYAPLSWEQVRSLSADGVEFGAHTVTHPILSRLATADAVRAEIGDSKRRIEQELDKAVAHFSFPNGLPEDIPDCSRQVLAESGLQTAVTTTWGQVRTGSDPLMMPRVAVEPADAMPWFQQCAAAFRLSR